MKLALLGAGGIARAVAQAAADGYLPGANIVAVAGLRRRSPRAAEIAAIVGAEPTSAEGLLAHRPEWVLEAAGASAVNQHLLGILDHGANVVVMSIGALLDESLWRRVEACQAKGRQVVLPSGGIGGLDAVRALGATSGLHEASITTTKAPAGLRGAPYLTANAIELPENRPLKVFDGPAREAVKGFPANANVAAALSFAGIGPDRTRVIICSDPSAPQTRHKIRAIADAGNITIDIEALPDQSNPRTSYLAGLSAISTLQMLLR